MEQLLKSKEKEKQKNIISSMILMQVAKSGIINKKTAAEKFQDLKKSNKSNNLKLIK